MDSGHEENFPIEEDPKEGSSIKVPPQGGPEYPAKLETKTKTDVTIAISEDTLRLNVPRRIRVSPKKSSEGKKFEDYTYAYGGAEEPQLCHTSIHCYHNKTPTVPHTLTQH